MLRLFFPKILVFYYLNDQFKTKLIKINALQSEIQIKENIGLEISVVYAQRFFWIEY